MRAREGEREREKERERERARECEREKERRREGRADNIKVCQLINLAVPPWDPPLRCRGFGVWGVRCGV